MVTTITFVTILLLLLLGALLGAFRGGMRAAIRLGTVLLALLGAFLLSGSLASAMNADEITAKITELSPELAELLLAAPSLYGVIYGLFRPIIFLVAFLVLVILLEVVFLILSLFLKKPKKKATGLGVFFGLVQGLLVLAVVFTPVLGYATLANDLLADTEKSNTAAVREEYIAPLAENPVLATLGKVTSPLFAEISSFKVGDSQISIREEAPLLFAAFKDIRLLSGKEMSTYGEDEKAALLLLSDHFGSSKLLPTVTAELLSAAAGRWSAGETFIGIEAPHIEGNFETLFDTLISLLASSTTDTVVRDFDTITEFFVLLIDYDILTVAEGEGDFTEAMTKKSPTSGKSFIEEALALLDATPHLAPLRDSVVSLGAQAVISQLGTAEEIRESCAPMVEELTDILQSLEGDTDKDKIEALTPTIKEELEKNKIDLPSDAVDVASRFLLEELEKDDISLESITEDDIYAILDRIAAEGV